MFTGTLPSPNRGFSLVELLFAIVLSSLVLIGMASIQSAVLRQKGLAWNRAYINVEAMSALESIRSSVSQASYILSPGPGDDPGDKLTGYINVDPLDGSSPLVGARPQQYFMYCLSREPQQLYAYFGDFPLPPIECGEEPKGVHWTILANNPLGKKQLSVLFHRPQGANNMVEVRYKVRFKPHEGVPAITFGGGTQIQTQELVR